MELWAPLALAAIAWAREASSLASRRMPASSELTAVFTLEASSAFSTSWASKVSARMARASFDVCWRAREASYAASRARRPAISASDSGRKPLNVD
eukprot:11481787-Alexandrium_andersonii.AAC.1